MRKNKRSIKRNLSAGTQDVQQTLREFIPKKEDIHAGMALETIDRVLKVLRPDEMQRRKQELLKHTGYLKRADSKELIQAVNDIFDGLSVFAAFQKAFRKRLEEVKKQVARRSAFDNDPKMLAAKSLRSRSSNNSYAAKVNVLTMLQQLIDEDMQLKKIIKFYKKIYSDAGRFQSSMAKQMAKISSMGDSLNKQHRAAMQNDSLAFQTILNNLTHAIGEEVSELENILKQVEQQRKTVERKAQVSKEQQHRQVPRQRQRA